MSQSDNPALRETTHEWKANRVDWPSSCCTCSWCCGLLVHRSELCKKMWQTHVAALRETRPAQGTPDTDVLRSRKIAHEGLTNPAMKYRRHWLPGSFEELLNSVADAILKDHAALLDRIAALEAQLGESRGREGKR